MEENTELYDENWIKLRQSVMGLLELNGKYRAVNTALNGLISPQKPTQASWDEVWEHLRKRKIYDDEFTHLRNLRTDLSNGIKQTERTIIGLIPVSNVWIKVGEFAIGKYWCNWGVAHTEIAFAQWGANLPELRNDSA